MTDLSYSIIIKYDNSGWRIFGSRASQLVTKNAPDRVVVV